MITAKHIESRLRTIDYTKPNPDRELLVALASDGRTRILKTAQTDGLCPLSDKYFEFCLSQVGSFCTAGYNAVEIAMSIGVQPIYVAAHIHLHGCDWAHRLLGLKRFACVDRGQYTVWSSGEAWFALGECQRRSKQHYGISSGQEALRKAIQKSEMPYVFAAAVTHPHRLMSILRPREGLLYRDPRVEKTLKQRAKAAAEAKAEGRSVLTTEKRSEYGDMGKLFNGHLSRGDKTGNPRVTE